MPTSVSEQRTLIDVKVTGGTKITSTSNSMKDSASSNAAATLPIPRERTRDKIAGALKSSVVYGGSAILNAANAITPHLAGAVDIMVVEQPDGRLLSTPFFVRFGKYSTLRNKEREVKLYVNDELVDFHMHLGSYGHAYLLERVTSEASTSPVRSTMPPNGTAGGAEESAEALLAGMMSPCTVYGSSDEEDADGEGSSRRSAMGMPERALGSVREAAAAEAAMSALCDGVIQRLGGAEPSAAAAAAAAAATAATAASNGGSAQQLHLPAGHPFSPGGESRWGQCMPAVGMSGATALAQHLGHLSNHAPFQEMRDAEEDPGSASAAVAMLGATAEAMAAEARRAARAGSIEPIAGGVPEDIYLTSDVEAEIASALGAMLNERGGASSLMGSSPDRSISMDGSEGQAEGVAGRSDAGLSCSGYPRQTSAGGERMGGEQGGGGSLHSCYVSSNSMSFMTSGSSLMLEGEAFGVPSVATASPAAVAAAADQADAAQQQWHRHTSAAVPCSPSSAATAAAAIAVLQGVELSECGRQLSAGTPLEQAHRSFDAQRVGPEGFAALGKELLSSPDLMVRVGGRIYPWSLAAPMVVGGLLFGCRWEHLVAADTPSWGPLPGTEPGAWGLPSTSGEVDRSGAAGKKASAGWSLWPWGGRRERADDQAHAQAADTAAAASPSGSRFTRSTSGALVAGGPLPSLASAPCVLELASAKPSMPSPTATGRESSSFAAVPAAMPSASVARLDLQGVSSGPPPAVPRASTYNSSTLKKRKALTPTPEQLASLKLKPGRNRVTYRIGNTTELSAYIYLLRWNSKIVISDVDGTITKSDVLGHLLPAMGWDWSHPGITQLLSDVSDNGYQVMYLSSRSIGQANITREYLNTIVQGKHRMPLGPVIISPDGILPSLYREMILRRPHEFKIAALQDIRNLFPPEWNPFYAGFGNRDTDVISYKAVGVPSGRIFIINPRGELYQASISVRSSALSTLRAINELIGNIFPSLPAWSSERNATGRRWSRGFADVGSSDEGGKDGDDFGGSSPRAAQAVSRISVLDEQYNDMNYWGRAGSLEADMELMGKYMPSPSFAPAASGASSAIKIDARRAGLVQPGARGLRAADGASSFDRNKVVASRVGSDFITSYNPFAS